MTVEVKPKDREAIERYLDSLKLDRPASAEEVRDILRGAIGDRGLMVYLAFRLIRQGPPPRSMPPAYLERHAVSLARSRAGSWEVPPHRRSG